jgi:hypothetical protein
MFFIHYFLGDLSSLSYGTFRAESIIQSIFHGISKSTKPNEHLSPCNTLLPYIFLKDIKYCYLEFFPALCIVPYRETPEDRGINFSEFFFKTNQ